MPRRTTSMRRPECLFSLGRRLMLVVGLLLCALATPLLLLGPRRYEADARHWTENRAAGIARVLASASGPAVDFDDPVAAGRILADLRFAGNATWAALLRFDGSLLAG